ncbi:uncharacterized protein K489DRAFT_376263 [Dissoconium aciculare CBS 342.82]|jgi:hypothetical protein|uniref:F-box domain-containing protein n=1 Tax=Dissoconium aciculare CBS 342.82 TaxID=1314786 RepID=A0A6J3ME34_9PEZI|nr:uncharacterized protein K489DRAFT_376263 [Dissoconium aciculare CBS 342.82]KAF1825869.1 hypothetical protein K489DRAFT_376263 [Dissoconium aciculare CBS 342.82]
MAGGVRLLKLPAELVERIAEYVDDADLIALRSTCRIADSQAIRVVRHPLSNLALLRACDPYWVRQPQAAGGRR